MSQRRFTTGVVTVAQSWPVAGEQGTVHGAYIEVSPPPPTPTRLGQVSLSALVGSDLAVEKTAGGLYVEQQAPLRSLASSQVGSYAEQQVPYPEVVALVGAYTEGQVPHPAPVTAAGSYVEATSYNCVVASSHKVYIELIPPPPPGPISTANGAYVELWGGGPVTGLSSYVEAKETSGSVGESGAYVERLNRYGTVQQAGGYVELQTGPHPRLSRAGVYLEKTPPDNYSQPRASTAALYALVAAGDAVVTTQHGSYVEHLVEWPDDSGSQATVVSGYLEGKAVAAFAAQTGVYLECRAIPLATATGAYLERFNRYGAVHQVGSYLEAEEKLAGIGQSAAYFEGKEESTGASQVSFYLERLNRYGVVVQASAYREAKERRLTASQSGFYVEIRGSLLATRLGAYQEALERFLRAGCAGAYSEAVERFLRSSRAGYYWEGVERLLRVVGAPGLLEFRQRRIRASRSGLYWEGDYVAIHQNGAPAYIEGKIVRVDIAVAGHYLELGGSRLLTQTGALYEFKERRIQQAGNPVYVEIASLGPLATQASSYLEAKELLAFGSQAAAYLDFRQRRIRASGAASLLEAKERFVRSTSALALLEAKEQKLAVTLTGYYWERGGSLLISTIGYYWERRLRRLYSGPTPVYVETVRHEIRSSQGVAYAELARVHSLITWVAVYRERAEKPGPDVTQLGMMWEHKDRAGTIPQVGAMVEAKERFLRCEQSGYYWEGKETGLPIPGCGSYIELADLGPASTTLGVYVDKTDCGDYGTVVGAYLDKRDCGNYLPVVGAYLECSDLGVFLSQTETHAEEVHTKWIKLTAMGENTEFRAVSVTLTALDRHIELRDKWVTLTHLGRYIEAANVGAQMTTVGHILESKERFVRATDMFAYMERRRTRPIEVSHTSLGVYAELVKPGIASTLVATYYELKPWERFFTTVGAYAERIRETGTPVGDSSPGLLELHTRCYDMYRLIADWQSWEQGVLSEEDFIGDLEGVAQLRPGATPRYFKGKVYAYRDVTEVDGIDRMATVADLKKLWKFGPRVLFLRANHLLDVSSPFCLKVYWHGDLEIKWLDQGHSLAEVTLELIEIL